MLLQHWLYEVSPEVQSDGGSTFQWEIVVLTVYRQTLSTYVGSSKYKANSREAGISSCSIT